MSSTDYPVARFKGIQSTRLLVPRCIISRFSSFRFGILASVQQLDIIDMDVEGVVEYVTHVCIRGQRGVVEGTHGRATPQQLLAVKVRAHQIAALPYTRQMRMLRGVVLG